MTKLQTQRAGCGCARCRQAATYEIADRFETRVYPGGRRGHEILTAEAARHAGVPARLHTALIDGVIRPDRGGRSYLNFIWAAPAALLPGTQAAHALRATRWTATPAALRAIQTHFIDLYRRAMAAPPFSARAFEWLGEALHLLQDAYSQAHVERSPYPKPGARGPFRIVYIRNFGPVSGPREHGFPRDARDFVGPTGALKPEAQVAVAASADFLRMMMRHMRAPRAAGNPTELRAFIGRHLA